ncbi:phosphotransferase [Bacillus sp. B-jedd]|uniref:phosphotransferase n=1 Tax=Bacillus sp. B-jedd TaxID=1476857 RepID=UPI0005155A27|nr:phosphotransferase [Bacillus sp. B-jedd]CEG28007.1 aminoglycoside phosphotransferase [Bacillus sp. B-jedd]
MKAPISLKNHQGDDNFHYRLLSYLKKVFPGNIIKLDMIRPTVFLLNSSIGDYIIKCYSSYNRLKLQEAFTATLKKEGFTSAYSYLRPGRREPYYLDGVYLGIIEFILPHLHSFSYHLDTDRLAGLNLLQNYHSVTEKIVQRYKTLIPPARLIEKWEQRQDRFEANKPVISYFVNSEMMDEISGWASFALEGMRRCEGFFTGEVEAILHGDVAHHNFLRAWNGKIYLIDFDLISIGPPVIDYLQYGNRILPFLNWSINELAKYRQLSAFMNEKGFLFALAYPADLLREWNRIFKNEDEPDINTIMQMKKWTERQFFARHQFIKKIGNMVKSG